MIKVVEIPFVTYPVTDRDRATAFYEGVLNLKPTYEVVQKGTYWIEYDIGTAYTLGISNFTPPSGQGGPAAALEVEDFSSSIQTLKEKNVPFAVEPVETLVCHLAVVKDPDGNTITIHKRKPKN